MVNSGATPKARQTLSAVFGGSRERVPAGGGPGLIGVLESGRDGDGAVGELRAVAVAGPVDRVEHLAGEARCFLQDIFDIIGREIRIDAVLDCALELAHVAHHEQHLIDGCAIGHGVTSSGSARCCGLWRRFFLVRTPPAERVPL